MDQIRQGDVLLQEVKEILGKEIEKDGNKAVLAYGEVTGHHHRFEGDHVKMFRHDDGSSFVALNKGDELIHEEHGAIAVLGTKYEQAFQVEYTPKELKRVRD